MSQFAFNVSDFLEHRAEREFTFPLHASSIGRKGVFEVRAHRLNLMDRASLGFLPDHLQNDVWQRLRAAARDIQKLQEQGGQPKDINEALANNDKMLAVANLFCRYAFIEPRLVLDVAEEDAERGVLHVDRIAPEDRIAFMIACTDADSEQARLFRTFRREPADDVPARQGGEVVPPAPIRPAGDARPGVQFVDPVHG